MNTLYENELEALRQKMIKAEYFANVVPIFADKIIKDKITGEEEWVRFDDIYKNLYLKWGINRGLFRSNSSRSISNYPKKHNCYLWCIYINTCDLYDSHEKYDLFLIPEKTPVFFYDYNNTTFYCQDSEIEGLLECLNDWYMTATIKNSDAASDKRISVLESEIEAKKKEINKLRRKKNNEKNKN